MHFNDACLYCPWNCYCWFVMLTIWCLWLIIVIEVLLLYLKYAQGIGMSRWDDDKVKVKDIFDTIRNFGLCGLVFFLATKSLFYVSSVEYFNVIHRATSACLYGLSLYLFYINTRLFNKIIKRRVWWRKSWCIFIHGNSSFVFHFRD